MNRRGFIASIPFLPPALKAVVGAPAPLKCVFGVETKVMELRSLPVDIVRPGDYMPTGNRMVWFIDWSDISATPAPIHRARLKLRRQLAMPPPNLP